MSNVKIEVDSQQVADALNRVQAHGIRLQPLLKNIGEALVNSTKERFTTSTDPEGKPWAANSQATYLAILGHGHSSKDGKLNSKGVNRVQSKRPLIASFALGTEIQYQLLGDGVEVGSNKVYAPMMQFGGKKSEFPNLWGDIPARPFLGVDASDEQNILDMALQYMGSAWY